MKFWTFTRSYNSFGGNKHFGLIGEFLEQSLGSYGNDVAEIEITAFFYPEGPPRRTLEQSYEDYKRGLVDLPKVRFFKTKRRIDIQYRSMLAESDYQRNYGPSTPQLISNACVELQDSFRLIDEKIKANTEFAVTQFHEDVARIVKQLPKTTEELELLREQLKKEREERRKQMDPWDLIEVEWKKFHPQARALLNDVFFWSCIDDYSPHGSDTGSDVLADFKKWSWPAIENLIQVL